jgi:hypothetical protein
MPSTDVNTQIPNQVSGLVTKLTGSAGRKNRGRMYIPFPSVADQDAVSQQPTANYVTDIAAIATGIGVNAPFTFACGAGNTVTLAMLVYNFKASPPATVIATNAFIARPRWATQKRRGDYGKPNAFPW